LRKPDLIWQTCSQARYFAQDNRERNQSYKHSHTGHVVRKLRRRS